MNPLIPNPTFNAVVQYVMLVGTVASIVSPLFAKLPAVYAVLQRLAAWGVDMSKAFGATRVPTSSGPAPAPKEEGVS